jgi:hypothetical protein
MYGEIALQAYNFGTHFSERRKRVFPCESHDSLFAEVIFILLFYFRITERQPTTSCITLVPDELRILSASVCVTHIFKQSMINV